MKEPIEQSGFILSDGRFVDDWEAWKAEEMADDQRDELALGIEYAAEGRLDDVPVLKVKKHEKQDGVTCFELKF